MISNFQKPKNFLKKYIYLSTVAVLLGSTSLFYMNAQQQPPSLDTRQETDQQALDHYLKIASQRLEKRCGCRISLELDPGLSAHSLVSGKQITESSQQVARLCRRQAQAVCEKLRSIKFEAHEVQIPPESSPEPSGPMEVPPSRFADGVLEIAILTTPEGRSASAQRRLIMQQHMQGRVRSAGPPGELGRLLGLQQR